MNNKVNGPFLTLSDLYNDDIVYTSRPSYVSNPWLKPDEIGRASCRERV